jgi:hypothetical protein
MQVINKGGFELTKLLKIVSKTARQLLEEQENSASLLEKPALDRARTGTSDGNRRSDILQDV